MVELSILMERYLLDIPDDESSPEEIASQHLKAITGRANFHLFMETLANTDINAMKDDDLILWRNYVSRICGEIRTAEGVVFSPVLLFHCKKFTQRKAISDILTTARQRIEAEVYQKVKELILKKKIMNNKQMSSLLSF